jgi:general secretion pathway protein E
MLDWKQFTQALVEARRRHKVSGGLVSEYLTEVFARPDFDLLDLFFRRVGCSLIPSRSDCRQDYSIISLEESLTWNMMPMRNSVTGRWIIAMADPWDDVVFDKCATLLHELPVVALLMSDMVLERSKASCAGQGASHINSSLITFHAGENIPAFVRDITRHAFSLGVSDIHFESARAGLRVRFRLDGVLSTVFEADDSNWGARVISSIKVAAMLDITEHRVPQDGRLRIEVESNQSARFVDLRVSVMPNVFGEDIVLRILDKAQFRQDSRGSTLSQLGFSDIEANRFLSIAKQPHGLMLVTGPTGAGKTTTVYAALRELHSGIAKVVTIEDPVEYELDGALQIPVNEAKGLTFARGLRSILRHDPDRILVGEIRDGETAEIAVQAALTGHQVFSTIHANNIIDVIGRFRHFGIDMFGFMSSLNGVVVQRLLRRLCRNCRVLDDFSDGGLPVIDSLAATLPTSQRWRSAGCAKCFGSGFHGRIVVSEIHEISDALRDLVVAGGSVAALRLMLETGGNETLESVAARMIASGETTSVEVDRVLG